ncbi:MAG: peptide deformylase, partial [Nitrospirota bacterium]|nr:peptide deformylase [Nitrospirota bacterium]
MAILPIAKIGNPVLRQQAKPVDPASIGSRRVQEFLDDMFETMVHYEGIGLAAPQVAQSEQIVVMECEGKDGIPKT